MAVVVASAIAWSPGRHLRASGPGIATLNTFVVDGPVSLKRYGDGELGVVKPTYSRRSLIQAYRVFSGRPPIGAAVLVPAWQQPVSQSQPSYDPPDDQFWQLARSVMPGLPGSIGRFRVVGTYEDIENCNDSTWATALRVLKERIARDGGDSREVADWLRAQVDVFRNCDGKELVLPAPVPAWADATLRADRDYQTASAYFYATEYEESARRFLAIAADGASRWQPYGRYLAARSMIRQATVKEDGAQRAARLSQAETELRRVLADRQASIVQASAQGLLQFVSLRLHPEDRVRELGRRLADSPNVTDNDIVDFLWLLDSPSGRSGAPGTDDVADWIVTIRAEKGTGADHAIERWRATRSMPWLVAALWTMAPTNSGAVDILAAAAAVPQSSPAFATVTANRLRLLVARGAGREAQQLLASLPQKAASAKDTELVNIARAVRMRFATTFEGFLDNAPREVLFDPDNPPSAPAPTPTFDDDAAMLFSTQLPLDRLADAAESTRLPRRLRIRLSQVAFTRATVLRRYDAATRVARVLATLTRAVRDDANAFLAAQDDVERQRAALLLLLRTPGMRLAVWGLENDWAPSDEPQRQYQDFAGYWWCSATPQTWSPAPLTKFLYGDTAPQSTFIAPADRAAAASELMELQRASSATEFLAREAIAWARATPGDSRTAEALSRVVRGGRYSHCPRRSGSEARDSGLPLAKRAFVLLHRLHPQSEWAKRTKYWYDSDY